MSGRRLQFEPCVPRAPFADAPVRERPIDDCADRAIGSGRLRAKGLNVARRCSIPPISSPWWCWQDARAGRQQSAVGVGLPRWGATAPHVAGNTSPRPDDPSSLRSRLSGRKRQQTSAAPGSSPRRSESRSYARAVHGQGQHRHPRLDARLGAVRASRWRPPGRPNVVYVVLDDVGFSAHGLLRRPDRHAEHRPDRRGRACATPSGTPRRCARRPGPAC